MWKTDPGAGFGNEAGQEEEEPETWWMLALWMEVRTLLEKMSVYYGILPV